MRNIRIDGPIDSHAPSMHSFLSSASTPHRDLGAGLYDCVCWIVNWKRCAATERCGIRSSIRCNMHVVSPPRQMRDPTSGQSRHQKTARKCSRHTIEYMHNVHRQARLYSQGKNNTKIGAIYRKRYFTIQALNHSELLSHTLAHMLLHGYERWEITQDQACT